MHYDKLIKILGEYYTPFSELGYVTNIDGNGNGLDAIWNPLSATEQKKFIEYFERIKNKAFWFTMLVCLIDIKIFKTYKMFHDTKSGTGVMDIKTYFETIKRLKINAKELEQFATKKIQLRFPVHPSHVAYRLKHTLEYFKLSRNDKKLYLSLFKEIGYNGFIKQSKITDYLDIYGYSEEEIQQKQLIEHDIYNH